MIQNILVAVIILGALTYIAWSVYRSVRPGEKAQSACGGCTGCDLKNMKNSCEHPSDKNKSGIKNKVFEKELSQTNWNKLL